MINLYDWYFELEKHFKDNYNLIITDICVNFLPRNKYAGSVSSNIIQVNGNISLLGDKSFFEKMKDDHNFLNIVTNTLSWRLIFDDIKMYNDGSCEYTLNFELYK